MNPAFARWRLKETSDQRDYAVCASTFGVDKGVPNRNRSAPELTNKDHIPAPMLTE
jgi:hypothetical protein